MRRRLYLTTLERQVLFTFSHFTHYRPLGTIALELEKRGFLRRVVGDYEVTEDGKRALREEYAVGLRR